MVLSECGLPGSRQTRQRQLDGNGTVWPTAAPLAALPNVPGTLFRAERNAAVRQPLARAQDRDPAPAHRRGLRGAANQPFGRREQEYGGPLLPIGGRPGPETPRRVRGFFPPTPARFSSTKNGRLSAKRRSIATATTPTMTCAGIAGTTLPSIRNIASWSAWLWGGGPKTTPNGWSMIFTGERKVAP